METGKRREKPGPSDNDEAGTSKRASVAEILLLEGGVISEMWIGSSVTSCLSVSGPFHLWLF